MMQILECAQGSAEWFEARRGLPTASEFSTVMAQGEGKTRRKYMLQLAGEILTDEPMSTFTNAQMERGKVMEEEAGRLYAFMGDEPIRRVGFIRNGGKGASPDRLVGERGGAEVKTAEAHIQIDRLLRDKLPSEHRAQVQGNIWIAEREWWDFVSYWPKLPLFVLRVYRDDAYIKLLEAGVREFNEELVELVDKIKRLGGSKAG